MKKIILIALLLTSSVCSARGLFDWCPTEPRKPDTYSCIILETEISRHLTQYEVFLTDRCYGDKTDTKTYYKEEEAHKRLEELQHEGLCYPTASSKI